MEDELGRYDSDFLVVFNSNFSSITYRFQDKEAYLLAGNDVIDVSPLEGVFNHFQSCVLKVQPRLPISVL